MTKLLLKNVELLNSPKGERSYIAIKGNKITYVGTDFPEDYENAQVLDCSGKLATPGMVNTHGHVSMTILRSYADDLELMDWLNNHIWPIENKMDANDMYWGAMLGMVEMLKGGTTTFADMYFNMEHIAQACIETGIRANLSRGLIGFGSQEEIMGKIEENKALYDNWHNFNDGQIRVSFGPHAPYTCPIDYLKEVIKAAESRNAEIQMHLCETKFEVETHMKEQGCTPIETMDKLGMFELGTVAAHAVHLTDNDIKIMAKKKVRVAHNPQSNLKLASGVAPVSKLLKAGVLVGIGTDGASSNNDLDMLEETRTAAILAKGITYDPLTVPAQKAWEMATCDGAKVLGFKNLGKLAKGQLADIVLWDTHKPYWYPRNNSLSQLVYAAKSTDADTVIVNGKIVVANGKMTMVDEEKIYAEAQACMDRLLAK